MMFNSVYNPLPLSTRRPVQLPRNRGSKGFTLLSLGWSVGALAWLMAALRIKAACCWGWGDCRISGARPCPFGRPHRATQT